MFKANFAQTLIRYYLMMLVVIIGGFTGYWLIALLALPIFLSAIMGYNPFAAKKVERNTNTENIKWIGDTSTKQRAAG